MRLTIVAAFLAISSHSSAQGWSITAHAPFVGTATASVLNIYSGPPATNSAGLPVGPVLPGTFLTCSATHPFTGGLGSVSMSCIPSVVGSLAPLAFTTNSLCGSQGSYVSGNNASASGNARIDLTLHAPQPVGGRLWVRTFGSDTAAQYSSASSRIDLDVNADGTIEVSAQTGATSPLDVPLQIPATGAVIRLSYNSSASSSAFISGGCQRQIEALFFPGEPVVAPFATFNGASTMSVDHGSPGMVTLSIEGTGLTPVLMAIGGTAINVPLLPYVTVLVSPDVLIANVGSITLPLPPFPPGTALYAQGLVLDSVGTPRGTNSVRALWL